MGKFGILILCFLAAVCGLFLAIAFSQQEDPLVRRAVNYKTVTGEVRLRSSKATIHFNQDERFSDPPTVWVQLIDSSTASSPDSLRAFAVGRLSPTGFTIRSLKFTADTVLVRYIAIGK